jgi:hypothetical protein
MRHVFVESPFRGRTRDEMIKNVRYARACMRDCLLRGETPYASHLLYTQEGVLDDDVPEERELGIRAGVEWARVANALHVVYTDLGISFGMRRGIEGAWRERRAAEYRKLGDGWETEYNRVAKKQGAKIGLNSDGAKRRKKN